jgi:hypothetical protein
MFSKQHFEKIAKLVKNSESETKQDFILDLVKLFACDNSKFDQSRFLKASGLNELSLSANSKNKKVISVPKLTNLRIIPSKTGGYRFLNSLQEVFVFRCLISSKLCLRCGLLLKSAIREFLIWSAVFRID